MQTIHEEIYVKDEQLFPSPEDDKVGTILLRYLSAPTEVELQSVAAVVLEEHCV